MLLSNIRHYLKQREQFTVDEVVNRFDLDSDSAQFAIDYWINKKKVNIIGGASCNSACGSCSKAKVSYQWVERRIKFLT